jgi:hypothetical protein
VRREAGERAERAAGIAGKSEQGWKLTRSGKERAKHRAQRSTPLLVEADEGGGRQCAVGRVGDGAQNQERKACRGGGGGNDVALGVDGAGARAAEERGLALDRVGDTAEAENIRGDESAAKGAGPLAMGRSIREITLARLGLDPPRENQRPRSERRIEAAADAEAQKSGGTFSDQPSRAGFRALRPSAGGNGRKAEAPGDASFGGKAGDGGEGRHMP